MILDPDTPPLFDSLSHEQQGALFEALMTKSAQPSYMLSMKYKWVLEKLSSYEKESLMNSAKHRGVL